MKKIRKRSPVPLYGTATVWIIYVLIFPLYKPSHFIYLILVDVAAYVVLSRVFPGTVEEVEEPKEPEEPFTTGNEEADALLREGEKAVSELDRLSGTIQSQSVRDRIATIRDLTEKIFRDIVDDPADIPQVRRFAGYFLPTTLKLLNAYDRMAAQGIPGSSIQTTMDRIEGILDTTIEAYRKQLDALFANEALDIETDITVLEGMLKREGLSGKDF